MKSHIDQYNSLVERLGSIKPISHNETDIPTLLREWAYDNLDFSTLSDDPLRYCSEEERAEILALLNR